MDALGLLRPGQLSSAGRGLGETGEEGELRAGTRQRGLGTEGPAGGSVAHVWG